MALIENEAQNQAANQFLLGSGSYGQTFWVGGGRDEANPRSGFVWGSYPRYNMTATFENEFNETTAIADLTTESPNGGLAFSAETLKWFVGSQAICLCVVVVVVVVVVVAAAAAAVVVEGSSFVGGGGGGGGVFFFFGVVVYVFFL